MLRLAVEDAEAQGKNGLVTVAGTSKFHFMSDTKWLLKHGFESCETTKSGFSLLVKKINPKADNPRFKESVKSGTCEESNGLVVYYSNRCPFSEYHVTTSLTETAANRITSYNVCYTKLLRVHSRQQRTMTGCPR